MLKYYIGSTTLALLPPLNLSSTTVSSNGDNSSVCTAASNRFSLNGALKLGTKRVSSNWCRASRRRVRYNDDDEDEEDEEYGYNAEIAMLESYSQSARDEALILRARVDEEEAEVLIFRGFSSSLSYRTSPDPSRSILPARAVIKSIDRVKGPFDPSNIEYLEKGLTWDTFKSRLQPQYNEENKTLH